MGRLAPIRNLHHPQTADPGTVGLAAQAAAIDLARVAREVIEMLQGGLGAVRLHIGMVFEVGDPARQACRQRTRPSRAAPALDGGRQGAVVEIVEFAADRHADRETRNLHALAANCSAM